MREPTVSEELANVLGGTGRPIRWERLTAPEARDLLTRTDCVIIPVGATEQHGPHMAMCVDTEIAYHVALGVSALTGVPVVPPVSYGVSASHGDLPGTIAIRPETLIMLIEDLVASLHARGVRQFVLLNGHTWNSGALDVCAEKLRVRFGDARVRYLAYVTMYPGAGVDGRVTYGRGLMHANYFETSLMLWIDPDVVHMSRAVSLTDRDSFWDYRMDQVSGSGVWGRDIEKATAEHGEAEMRRCIETTARAIAAGVSEPWPQPR